MNDASDDDFDPVGFDFAPFLPLLEQALAEDRARDDVTVAALIEPSAQATADIVAKASGVVCGLPLVEPTFLLLDPGITVEGEYEDGDQVGAGATLMTLHGAAAALLAGERTALNVIRHLSGVATLTARFVEGTMATGTGIYDTRKTTPGWRALEKYAVRCGGGRNHRMDLADAAMIKENHLRAAYGTTGPEAIGRAVAACKAALPDGTQLYVEVESQAELEAAVEAGATILMLDEFDLSDIRRAVRYIRQRPSPRPELEVTGGVSVEAVEAYASSGVARISVGALTHSAPALDLSMKIRPA